jgi:hypothetical protein
MSEIVTERDLALQIEEVQLSFPKLKDHELFLVWFLRATITDDLSEAAKALTGNSHDKGADAVYIDDRAKVAFIIQSKFHAKVNGNTEPRADVMSFANLSCQLCGSEDDFKEFCAQIDPRVQERLQQVRSVFTRRGYTLKLLYVTTGRCSKPLIGEAEKECRRWGNGNARLEVFEGNRVLHILNEYLDGVAPPIPSMDLPLEIGNGVSSDCLKRHDSHTGITAWIFSMNAESVAAMYRATGVRLFARNVRGYLGDKKEVNKGIQATVKSEPSNFWYYNNGITIVCDRAEHISVGGKDTIRVSNPQVINGQQTTRTLAASVSGNSSASVIVRAISVPRTSKSEIEQFDTLVSRIVAATNFQNSISASDLMSNDRRQVELERELKKFNYAFLRKRQSKSEARRFVPQHYAMITKEEVAQAVAACELDPVIVRSEGKDGLFGEEYYSKIFPTGDPLFYLTRFRLMKEVRLASKGYPERAYAKWLVLNYVWSRLAPTVRAKSTALSFIHACEKRSDGVVSLQEANGVAFRAALAYFKKTRGKGERAADVSSFFKHKGLPGAFNTFLVGEGARFRQTFDKHWIKFERDLAASDLYPKKSKAATAN